MRRWEAAVAILGIWSSGCVIETGGETIEGGQGGSSSSSSTGQQTQASVKAGDPCTADDQCGTGSRCVDSILPGWPRYCAPSCTADDQCGALTQGDTYYDIELAPNLAAANQWSARRLSRAYAGCVNPADYPITSRDGNRYCSFVCPLNSAAVYNDDGAVSACACLPNYTALHNAEGALQCVWDNSVECSLFKGCTLANTEVGECSASDFHCIVNESLEGTCFDWVTGDQIGQCVFEKCSDANCDTSCLSGCGATPSCVESCCSC